MLIHIAVYAALIAVIIILSFQSIKWYISTTALLNWAARKGLTPPTVDELNRSVRVVIRNIIKNIFKRK